LCPIIKKRKSRGQPPEADKKGLAQENKSYRPEKEKAGKGGEPIPNNAWGKGGIKYLVKRAGVLLPLDFFFGSR